MLCYIFWKLWRNILKPASEKWIGVIHCMYSWSDNEHHRCCSVNYIDFLYLTMCIKYATLHYMLQNRIMHPILSMYSVSRLESHQNIQYKRKYTGIHCALEPYTGCGSDYSASLKCLCIVLHISNHESGTLLQSCQAILDISGSPFDFQWGFRKYPG